MDQEMQNMSQAHQELVKDLSPLYLLAKNLNTTMSDVCEMIRKILMSTSNYCGVVEVLFRDKYSWIEYYVTHEDVNNITPVLVRMDVESVEALCERMYKHLDTVSIRLFLSRRQSVVKKVGEDNKEEIESMLMDIARTDMKSKKEELEEDF